jgi:AAA domain
VPIEPVKTILCAHSGSGKTGASASLAALGLKLRYLDLDNGVDVLRNLLTDPESCYVKDNRGVGANLESVVQLAETRLAAGGKLTIQRAEVWPKATALLDAWKDPSTGRDFGSITSWTPEHVLVVGSFTRLATSCLRFIQALNGRLNAHPYQSDYGDAQNLLRSFLENVTSPEVNCNVVLECHIDVQDMADGTQKDFPKAVGKALSPDVATYFNTLLEVKIIGRGDTMRRVIKTVPTGTLGVKNTAPFRVPAEYPLETGLAQYFSAVRGSAEHAAGSEKK